MAGRPLEIALIGAGRMGRSHLEALSGSDSISITAVADPSSDALARVADLHPDISGHVDPADALAQPGIEACVIAASTPTHPDLVRAALAAGKHVLCEKPLALDPTESRALGAQAAGLGLVLQVGFWRRFSPPWIEARRMVTGGDIGRPLMIRLSQWDADPPPPGFCDPAVSGGLAIDCGVHEYDLVEWLTGEQVEAVTAWTTPVLDPGVAAAGDVDNLVAVLTLSGGAVATVDLSRNCRYGDDVRTELLGSEGAVFVEMLPEGLTRAAGRAGLTVIEDSRVADATRSGLRGQAAAFHAAVRNGRPPGPGAENSARAIEIGRAVIRAVDSGSTIDASSGGTIADRTDRRTS